MQERKLHGRFDLVIIAIILTIAIGIYLLQIILRKDGNEMLDETFAEISLNGTIIKTMSLGQSDDTVFQLDENDNVYFEINQGAIRFKSSDCLDQICVHSGFLSEAGQITACLPNGLTLKIFSDNVNIDEPDMIAQ